MTESDIVIGGIYQTDWSPTPIRVLLLDEHEVLYEGKDNLNNWSLTNSLRRKCYFFRTSINTLLSSAAKLGSAELTEEEISVIQPKLPLRFGRFKEFSWNNIQGQSQLENRLHENFVIEINSLVLVPFGPKGGLKKGVEINSENQNGFKLSELMWQASQIQSKVYNKESSGIGIYRLGYEKGMPSFYIGEFHDLAGILLP